MRICAGCIVRAIAMAAPSIAVLPNALAQTAMPSESAASRTAQTSQQIQTLPLDAKRAIVLPLFIERARGGGSLATSEVPLAAADATAVADFPRREADFDAALSAEADERLRRVCEIRRELDAVTLAAEMTSIRTYNATQRRAFYAGLVNSLSGAGRRALDQWVQRAPISGQVGESDWTVVAAADPAFYRSRVDSVCTSLAQDASNPPLTTSPNVELVMPGSSHSREP